METEVKFSDEDVDVKDVKVGICYRIDYHQSAEIVLDRLRKS